KHFEPRLEQQVGNRPLIVDFVANVGGEDYRDLWRRLLGQDCDCSDQQESYRAKQCQPRLPKRSAAGIRMRSQRLEINGMLSRRLHTEPPTGAHASSIAETAKRECSLQLIPMK